VTLSALLMIINVAILWWLFMSTPHMALKIVLVLLALLNSWVALERFQVVPTRLGGKRIIRMACAPAMGQAPREKHRA
jgi:hypothetical protein